jgi:hypothetical protein
LINGGVKSLNEVFTDDSGSIIEENLKLLEILPRRHSVHAVKNCRK